METATYARAYKQKWNLSDIAFVVLCLTPFVLLAVGGGLILYSHGELNIEVAIALMAIGIGIGIYLTAQARSAFRE